jgi:hypothetical protein
MYCVLDPYLWESESRPRFFYDKFFLRKSAVGKKRIRKRHIHVFLSLKRTFRLHEEKSSALRRALQKRNFFIFIFLATISLACLDPDPKHNYNYNLKSCTSGVFKLVRRNAPVRFVLQKIDTYLDYLQVSYTL